MLWEGRRVTLIDTGCGGAWSKIHLCLLSRGVSWRAVEHVLVTHSHVLANANLARVREASGARIHVHRLEAARLERKFSSSETRTPGFRLENWLARRFQVQPLRPDIYLQDQDIIETWNCLRVIHLPGHTRGHCGYYSRFHRIFFGGDLYAASAPWLRHLNPAWIDHDSEEAQTSRQRASSWPKTGQFFFSRQPSWS